VSVDHFRSLPGIVDHDAVVVEHAIDAERQPSKDWVFDEREGGGKVLADECDVVAADEGIISYSIVHGQGIYIKSIFSSSRMPLGIVSGSLIDQIFVASYWLAAVLAEQ
jgi:hypothetical protein